jgi:hypothetical protein
MENFTATILNPEYGSYYTVVIAGSDFIQAEAAARALYGSCFQYLSRW